MKNVPFIRQVVRYQKKDHVLERGVEIEVDWRPVFSAKPENNWKKATIQDILAAQFTAVVNDVAGDPLTFRFFTDVGDSWRP